MPRIELLLKTSTVPSRKVLFKAMKLASQLSCSIQIFVEDYRRSEDHTFLDFLSDSSGKRQRLGDQYLQWTAQVLEKAKQVAEDEELQYSIDFHRLEGRKWISQLTKALSGDLNLLLIDHSDKSVSPELLSALTRMNRNALLLGDKLWSSSPPVLAAIDPLHREDTAAKTDDAIVVAGRQISNMLSSKLTLVYCQYVAGYLNEYKNQILKGQKDGVLDFVEDRGLQKLPIHFAKGNPEVALPEAVSNSRAAILVMGACRRGSVSRFWAGSTVDVLLKKPPCDLLLVAAME
ncbi:universal stress protein [Vibrio mediterranei]|uniref:universal stress protein n=1 Tax=Vibrio mediterranei TaxID=689 RepID=UPI0040684192